MYVPVLCACMCLQCNHMTALMALMVAGCSYRLLCSKSTVMLSNRVCKALTFSLVSLQTLQRPLRVLPHVCLEAEPTSLLQFVWNLGCDVRNHRQCLALARPYVSPAVCAHLWLHLWAGTGRARLGAHCQPAASNAHTGRCTDPTPRAAELLWMPTAG